MASDREEIDEIRRATLASPVRRHIERQIFAGRIRVGAKVNEVAVADDLGVSRGPVREALSQLEEAGWVVSIPQRGSFVREIGFAEAMEVYEVRIALAGPLAAGATLHASTASRTELSALPARMIEANAAGDVEGINALSQRFVQLLAEGCGNATLARMFLALHLTHRLFRLGALQRLGALADLMIPMNRVAIDQRADVIAAILARDAAAAAARYTAYVEASRERSRARHAEAEALHARRTG